VACKHHSLLGLFDYYFVEACTCSHHVLELFDLNHILGYLLGKFLWLHKNLDNLGTLLQWLAITQGILCGRRDYNSGMTSACQLS